MAWIKLNATDPPPPAGSDGNVHFRQSPGHAGTSDDPIPTSAFFNVVSWIGKLLDSLTMGAPSDGQVPTWDAASSSWKAKTQAKPIRAVAVSIDGLPTVPFARAVQVDYAGTIIGWSVSGCDANGSLTCEVDKHASSAPPSAPANPNTTTDKISASAPISMSSAQSASGDASSVASWTTRAVAQWDVVQLNFTAANSITRATVKLLIQT
jgi:hypothetical protein